MLIKHLKKQSVFALLAPTHTSCAMANVPTVLHVCKDGQALDHTVQELVKIYAQVKVLLGDRYTTLSSFNHDNTGLTCREETTLPNICLNTCAMVH